MILRKVTLSNWRALEKFEMCLEAGINVLQGRNEAGKSSVVEAIDWALYRDITGARIPSAEIRSIVPAKDPMARPSVEVDLEFPDCRATLLKILSEDSVKRECRLTIRRVGYADEHYDRTEAQKKLRSLLSADGLGEEKGGAAHGGLMVAHQGESTDFISDGTAAIRSTLGVGSDGQLALTVRLEKARAAIETLRRREILQDLETSAIEVARAGTDAAKIRDELKEARFQLEHFQNVTAQIEELRSQLEKLSEELEMVEPRYLAAKAHLESLGVNIIAQTEADKEVLSAQNREREALSARDQAQAKFDEIKRFRMLQAAAQRELGESEGAVESALRALEEAQKLFDAAQELQERTGREAESTRHFADAWRHYEAVFIAQNTLKEAKKAWEELQGLQESVSTSQGNLKALEKAPTRLEIDQWRRSYEKWELLKNEAAQGLQIDVELSRQTELNWSRDAEAGETHALSVGEKLHLAASTSGVLKIEGLGEIAIRTGARGVEELQREVAQARASLESSLGTWNIQLEVFPETIIDWEEKRSAIEKAESALKDSEENLRREAQRLGGLEMAERAVGEREAEFQLARENCKAFEGIIEWGGRNRREVKEALEDAERAAKDASTNSNRARNDAAKAAQQLRTRETEWHQVKARPDALREAIASRNEELERLESDGFDETARVKHLGELNHALARAHFEMEGATQHRRELGDGISQWKINDARRLADELAAEREGLEKNRAAKERDLFHACGHDAHAEIERLTVSVEELEEKASRHEARLRGVVLLDAIIQAERARLSRDLAGPLNEKLGPWLTQLRGKETSLAFDEAGSRIENILSRDSDSTISLPFSEHSEGLKEQVAFALRLLLATRVASHLPSKQLPLILDDPFTQSDAGRTGGLGEVLKDAQKTLQILFVTCHSAPKVSGVAVNSIQLGEFQDDLTLPVRRKSGGKSKTSSDKMVMAQEETLALF